MSVTPEQRVAHRLALPASIPSIWLGPPGTAKTMTARMVYEAMLEKHKDAVYVLMDMASLLPEDFTGLPYRDGNVTRYVPFDKLYSIMVQPDGSHPYGVLNMDDFSAAPPATQIVGMGILGPERMVGGHVLSKNVIIIATANRREDKAGAYTIGSATLNRCSVRTDLRPTRESWGKWALANNVPGVVVAWLDYRPSAGFTNDVQKDSDDYGRFPSYRAWYNLGIGMEASKDCMPQWTESMVGRGASLEFMAFFNLRSSLDPKAILEGKLLTEDERDDIRRDTSKATSLATALAEHASEDGSQDLARKLLEALAVNLSAEFGACGLRHYLNLNVSNLQALNNANWSGKMEGTPGGALYASACSALLGDEDIEDE